MPDHTFHIGGGYLTVDPSGWPPCVGPKPRLSVWAAAGDFDPGEEEATPERLRALAEWALCQADKLERERA